MSDALSGFFAADSTHILPVRVYYEDTDAGGIVYHANYLRFMERGRSAMLYRLGFRHTEVMNSAGVAFAVRAMEIDFLSPARLDDVLEVETRITKIGGASFAVAQAVRRGDRVLSRAGLKLATIDRAGQAARMPAAVREALTTLFHKQQPSSQA
ncbi:acyl-CoA thioester hydrolase [Azospirillum fermentarium]|uniref:tol-pal system-associated acyl-CoA thioesterase n=1 Tax=Azospirillum fermentarium TaxID=1233114 RepID=UPI002226B51D|nr:tol-pal system-associated acyl-CoA thioesterase [Azospirillum fermentarium]MCW2246006.1 acyl-CoA thioester hydrolase [Azospirillum fermentarium]